MNYFRNIFKLTSWDFIAKALYFLTFIYLARVLAVDSYGRLEFAISILAYFVLLADGGLELWATRAAAQGEGLLDLAAKIVPMRLLLALFASLVLVITTFIVPALRELQAILLVFGLLLPVQALNLKWLFMGQQKMGQVARGLLLSQLIFMLLTFALVRAPEDLIWVPLARLLGELAITGYFFRGFRRIYGSMSWSWPLADMGGALKSAWPLGVASTLAILSFNFDMVLLGFFSGTATVGLYAAAYKPVSTILAGPVSYFIGLFPALSQAYMVDREEYGEIVRRSFRLLALFAAPVAIVGTFLAADGINVLFGPAYGGAVPALRLLAWSASFTIMRGTFRQALNAAERQGLDLRCAVIAVGVNVLANLILIPRYGMIGAAAATVASELIWLLLAAWLWRQNVMVVPLANALWRPLAGALLLAAFFFVTPGISWYIRLVVCGLIYGAFLLISGEQELLIWLQKRPRFRRL